MKNNTNLAAALISLPIIITIFLIFIPELLIPRGYDLAIDGYVISRTMIIIFGLYLIFKLGIIFLQRKNS